MSDGTTTDVWEALRRKDAQILQLQQKLAHHRRWLGSVHARVQQSDPQALKNVRRLYIGGVPEDEAEVRSLTSRGSCCILCFCQQIQHLPPLNQCASWQDDLTESKLASARLAQVVPKMQVFWVHRNTPKSVALYISN